MGLMYDAAPLPPCDAAGGRQRDGYRPHGRRDATVDCITILAMEESVPKGRSLLGSPPASDGARACLR